MLSRLPGRCQVPGPHRQQLLTEAEPRQSLCLPARAGADERQKLLSPLLSSGEYGQLCAHTATGQLFVGVTCCGKSSLGSPG